MIEWSIRCGIVSHIHIPLSEKREDHEMWWIRSLFNLMLGDDILIAKQMIRPLLKWNQIATNFKVGHLYCTNGHVHWFMDP